MPYQVCHSLKKKKKGLRTTVPQRRLSNMALVSHYFPCLISTLWSHADAFLSQPHREPGTHIYSWVTEPDMNHSPPKKKIFTSFFVKNSLPCLTQRRVVTFTSAPCFVSVSSHYVPLPIWHNTVCLNLICIISDINFQGGKKRLLLGTQQNL